jgi:hypothetical protein
MRLFPFVNDVDTTCHGGGVGHALRALGFAESVKQEAESSEF